jgi:hypothetical protein
MFRPGAIATGGKSTRQTICPLRKDLWLCGCLGVEPRRDGIAFPEGFCDLGENNFG